ncbi:uncharacterized protein CC84DRAFT_1081348, partial [Paraphaeosphaeria sporulosa]
CALLELSFKTTFIYYGEGRHVLYLNSYQIEQAYKYSQLVLYPFIFSTAITKISVGFMVLRFSQTRAMRYSMYALMASLIVVNGACIVVLLSFCRPIYATWDIRVKHAVCLSSKILSLASGIQGLWSVVTDLICTSLPLVIVWKLHMGREQKIAVTVLVSFGLVTTGCSIGRCIYYATTKFPPDQTWSGIDLAVWTSLESNIGIFAANLPALGAMLNLKSIIVRCKWLSGPEKYPDFPACDHIGTSLDSQTASAKRTVQVN